MSTIKETTLHPDGNEGVDLYPKTNINQVQELPQKLTSVENQINQLNIDKLTKPVNPSVESAVTMLADGTVGTKPLSEFTKVYRYDIELQYVTSVDTWSCETYIYDTEEIGTFTIDMLKSKLPKVTNAVLNNTVGWGFFGSIYYPSSTSNKIQFSGNAINNEVTPVGNSYYLEIDVDACTIRSVTKTEI